MFLTALTDFFDNFVYRSYVKLFGYSARIKEPKCQTGEFVRISSEVFFGNGQITLKDIKNDGVFLQMDSFHTTGKSLDYIVALERDNILPIFCV